jgi:hypothetical protein
LKARDTSPNAGSPCGCPEPPAPLLRCDVRPARGRQHSTGLALLVRWAKAAQDGGPRFSVAPGSQVVRRLLDMRGVGSMLDVVSRAPAR